MNVEDWTEIVLAALLASGAVIGFKEILPRPEHRLLRAFLAAIFAGTAMFVLNLMFN